MYNLALFICLLSAYLTSHSMGQLLSIPFIVFKEGYNAFPPGLYKRNLIYLYYLLASSHFILSLENLVK